MDRASRIRSSTLNLRSRSNSAERDASAEQLFRAAGKVEIVGSGFMGVATAFSTPLFRKMQDLPQNNDFPNFGTLSIKASELRKPYNAFLTAGIRLIGYVYMQSCVNLVTMTSPPAEKIALFRARFRGREDVYARRFESRKSGKSGYSPACGLEWVPGICQKPRIKCAACAHRQFLPVTDEAVHAHLTGKDEQQQPFVMGVYPLLPDESCWFLALDLDKKDWREDVRALAQSCQRLQIPALPERSRSGNGAHLWIFFEETVPARLARQLGAALLSKRPGDHHLPT